MNISLRKANAVQGAIQEVLNSISIDTSIELNEFQDVSAELQQANDTLFANDARRQKLLLAFYNIRGLVGTANASCGINTSLAKGAFIDKRIAQLSEIANAKPVTDLAVVNGKLSKLRDSKDTDRGFGYRDSVYTSVVAKNQIEQAQAEIKNLKKQKRELNDEVLELNVKTEIPLSDDVVEVLQAEGLV